MLDHRWHEWVSSKWGHGRGIKTCPRFHAKREKSWSGWSNRRIIWRFLWLGKIQSPSGYLGITLFKEISRIPECHLYGINCKIPKPSLFWRILTNIPLQCGLQDNSQNHCLMLEANSQQIISKEKYGFWHDRKIHDAVSLAQEVVHSIARNNLSDFTMKLDLSKGYDHVRWTFLHLVLTQIVMNLSAID